MAWPTVTVSYQVCAQRNLSMKVTVADVGFVPGTPMSGPGDAQIVHQMVRGELRGSISGSTARVAARCDAIKVSLDPA